VLGEFEKLTEINVAENDVLLLEIGLSDFKEDFILTHT